MSPIREKEDMDEGAAEDGGQVAERDRAIEQIDQAGARPCTTSPMQRP